MMKSRDLYKIDFFGYVYIIMEKFTACIGDINKVKEWIKTNDVHIEDDHALRWSVVNRQLEIVRELIKAGANVHADNDNVLFLGANFGYLEIVQELIKAGANVNANNDSALSWSAMHGHLKVVRELIKAGANIYADNNSALVWSERYGRLKVIHELFKHYKYVKTIRFHSFVKSEYKSRVNHYINLTSIMIDLPCELYDEIARFI